MIFPILAGILSFRKAPITWALVLLNTLTLLWGWSVAWDVNDRLDALMGDDFFLETQGHIYENYLKNLESFQPDVVRELADTGATDVHHFRLLGHLAFRDDVFIKDAPFQNLYSDEVATKHWRKRLQEIMLLQDIHPSFLMGVSTDVNDFNKWISYNFSHTNGWHFAGNMAFLILFGAALEQIIGGLGLLVIFLASGVFAAAFFLWLCGPTTAPLIGASGAISGVMAMYCVLRWKQPERFFYWLLIPTRDSLGIIYLPAWAILALWAMGDIAGYVGNLDIMGGVAHAAHIGGDIAGIVCGVMIYGLWRWRNPERFATLQPHAGTLVSWKLYPLFQFSHISWKRR